MIDTKDASAGNFLHGDDTPEMMAVNHTKRVIDWAKHFHALDPADLEALAAVGVDHEGVARVTMGQSIQHSQGLRMMWQDLGVLVGKMTSSPQ